jgi:hypothetical protein
MIAAMMGRTMGSIGAGRGLASGGASVLGALACVFAALALGATPALAAETCPNEKLRAESDTNPTTGKPYSMELKDCRAYEMVSPLYKQGNDARPVTELNSLNTTGGGALPVAPDGETAGFESRGDFADPEDFHSFSGPENWYTSEHGPSGWTTYSTIPPASSLFADPGLRPNLGGPGLGSAFTPDLRSEVVNCGQARASRTELIEDEYTCAVSNGGPNGPGPWALFPAPIFTSPDGEKLEDAEYLGASSDLSHEFLQPELVSWLPSDTISPEDDADHGIYEVSGAGTTSPKLRLVNVDNEGKDLVIVDPENTAALEGPLLGDRRNPGAGTGGGVLGTAYQAISQSGETVFFSADSAVSTAREKLAVYARVHCPRPGEPGHTSACHEDDENYPPPPNNKSGEWLETVEVSAPSTECTSSCLSRAEEHPANATYQGASADGSKVFFTTKQPLVAGDGDETADLYEYEFNKAGNRLIQISAGVESGEHADPTPGAGAQVQGVVRTSEDGSHVYFVARGVLTTELNQGGEQAAEGANNLYGYDTVTGETRFIAKLGSSVEDAGKTEVSSDETRHAQTTPDGRYLVFSSKAHLAGETNNATAVYLYDFDTGALTWISHGAGEVKEREKTGVWGFNEQCKDEVTVKHLPKIEEEKEKENCEHEGKEALVASLPGTYHGGEAEINDWNRSISGQSEAEAPGKTPEERHDGEYVVFSTEERLQADDVDKAADVYEWHDGEVSMVSDGQDRTGVIKGIEADYGAMSATGSDIFFFTHTKLVGQDTDVLGDLYDARMNRSVGGEVELAGFPKPTVAPACLGEACQGATPPASPPALQMFQTPTSSTVLAGGNLTPASGGSLAFQTVTPPKPLTEAQKLAKALKVCKAERKKNRVACESEARRKYPVKGQSKGKKKTTVKKSDRRDT